MIKAIQALIYFIMGWAAGGLLDEVVEEIADEGKCVYRYSIKPTAECVQCAACMGALERFMDASGMSEGSTGHMDNPEMMRAMKELEAICPVGMVQAEVHCTTG